MKLSDIKVKTIKKPVCKESGFVLWEGLSMMDNNPIAVIATMNSNNPKTGNMIQVFIIRTDIAPHVAVKTNQDKSICGNCNFSGNNGCYVQAHNAPLAVYKAFHKGNYKRVSLDEIPMIAINRTVRLGAYGDPAFIPFNIIEALLKNSIGSTGYTHQYKETWFDSRILKYCMVSADNLNDAEKYNAMGYRTFTPIEESETIPDNSIVCPNITHNVQCSDCKLCDSANSHAKSIVAPIHGFKYVKTRFLNNRG